MSENEECEPFKFTQTDDGLSLGLFVGEKYIPFFASHARDLVSYGGAGAGKSYCAAQKIISKCEEYPNSKILITRKHGPSLRLTCFALVKELLRKYKIKHVAKEGQMIIDFPNGSQMLFIAIADTSGESADRIKSLTDITDMWFEEVTELTFEEYKTIRLRLRGAKLKHGYRQRIHTFNPIDKNHWLHKFFFEPDQAGIIRESERMQFTYKDNPFVDAEYIKELEELKYIDPVTYAVYALGEWGTIGNQIFTNYVIEEFDYPLKYYTEIVSGIDFGYDHPAVWLFMGVKGRDVYIIDEICKRKLKNSEFIQLILQDIAFYNIPNIKNYCEWAEPARLREMRESKLNIIEANKNVEEGFNVVRKYKIHIHPRCIETTKQIAGYRLKQDRAGNNLPGKPVKYNDDTCFIAGTKIETIKGLKNIEEITTNDYVLTRRGYMPVVASAATGYKEVITVQLSNKQISLQLTGTKNHPIWIEGKGFIPLDTLRYGDTITICVTKKKSYLMELNLGYIQNQKTQHIETTFAHMRDILEMELGIYIKKSGKQNMEKSQKAVISTTETEIPLTMKLQILNVLIQRHMHQTTLKNIIITTRKKLNCILKQSGRLQKNGINQKKVETGINYMEKSYGKHAPQSLNYVIIVKKNSKISLDEQLPDFVQTNVKQHGDVNRELMMNQEYVLSVEHHSKLISMKKQKHVLEDVKVISKVEQKQKQVVYNLTVNKEHEYFANGILVSNCDALRYGIMGFSDQANSNRFLIMSSRRFRERWHTKPE